MKLKKILKIILIIIIIIAAAFASLVLVLTVTEYKPDDIESLEINNTSNASKNLKEGDSLTLMTWNIGYGALGDNADFFMDGGSKVMTADKDRIYENLEEIDSAVESVDPDIVLVQEVDNNSKRSHHIDEKTYLADDLTDYCYTNALNYKVLYVPYPLPTIGKVDCGVATFSKYSVEESGRIQLPCPFNWPIRLGNLKRCLMVDRIPIEGSEKELVIVNLHLEAYSDAEGQIEQTNMLREVLEEEQEKGNYVIAGGDFNQTFSGVDQTCAPLISEDYWQAGSIDTGEFSDGWQFLMDEDTPSCRSLDKAYAGADKENFQYYIIDGFIVSSNLKVDDYEVLDLQFKNSDHNPLILNVTLQ